MSRKLNDLTGKRFERLFVISRAENNKFGNTQWLCQCDCGNQTIQASSFLTLNRVRSCGCLQKESIGNRARSHGLRKSRLYSIWAAMKSRCNSDDKRVTRYYKDRGIVVCNDWNKFENFYFDMNASYQEHIIEYGEKNTSLDRINPNLGYFKENCRWATPDIQAKNQRMKFILSSYDSISKFLEKVSKLKNIDATITKKQFNSIAEELRKG